MEKKLNAIRDFTLDLELIFPKEKPIVVYSRLFQHQLEKKQDMSKHLSLFQNWLKDNQQTILSKTTKLTNPKLTYSDTAFLDLNFVFDNSVSEDKKAVWEHLMNLNYLFFPSETHKQILKQSIKPSSLIPTNTKEGKFIDDAVNKLTETIDPNTQTDPGSLITNILSSGALGEIMSGLGSGDVDPKKLIGLAQNMLSNISQKLEDEKE